ncbi:MAG TPA: choice-of-anchor Q domain-containing protein [Chthoniobacterales bacterium]
MRCTSASDCWAVGQQNGALTLTEHWNGLALSIVASPNSSATFNPLYGLACPDPAYCWAVGISYSSPGAYSTLAERWNGSVWTIFASPNPGDQQGLFAVACVSTSDCWAVGFYSIGSSNGQTLIEHWNGSTWSVVSSPNNSAMSHELHAVTCVSSSDCWATGHYYTFNNVYQTLIEHWNGSTWSIVSSPNTSATETNLLYGVTCASTSDCWTVGNGPTQTLIEHWNGSAWSIVSSANNGPSLLSGVSCPSAVDCWAVGSGSSQTLIEHWNGAAWSIVSSPNTSDQFNFLGGGVTCVSASECWAVGHHYSTGGTAQTLVLRYSGPPPPPTLFPVNTIDDHNDGVCNVTDCTLREAITAANAHVGETLVQVNFVSGLTGVIQLTAALPSLAANITIQGPGANLLTVRRNTGGNYRIFNVNSGVNVNLNDLTIANGNLPGGFGGGIFNAGNLTLLNATVAGNTANGGGNGGGIYSSSVLTINNCTISGNSVSSIAGAGSGGGVYNFGGTLAVINSTVSGNTAVGPGGNSDSGGGIITNVGVVTLTNATISGNTADFGGGVWNLNGGTVRVANTLIALNNSPSGPDIDGTFISDGHNLIGNNSGGTGFTNGVNGDQVGVADPKLGALSDNGGRTSTIALLAGSPAIDAGDDARSPLRDQRGYIRAGTSDVGAFEFGGFLPTFTVTTSDDHNDGVCDTADCTLREAITTANTRTDETLVLVNFVPGLTGVIQLTAALPSLAANITVQGPGTNLLTVRRNTGGNYRVFTVNSGVVVNLNDLTIANGNLPGGSGGGINNAGTLTLLNATVSGNTANTGGNGGAIFNSSGLTIKSCTISGNSVSSSIGAGSGGGIYNSGGTLNVINSSLSGNTAVGPGGNSDSGGAIITNVGRVTLTNATITGNTADFGGGVWNLNGGTVHSGNTIIALNTAPIARDVDGVFISDGHNLIGNNNGSSGFTNGVNGDQVGVIDPKLGALGDNGGRTFTIALLAGSPAIDAGDDARAPLLDQRNYSRTAVSDVGAFEFNGVAPPAPQILSAGSGKVHGNAGSFDLDLPASGNAGVECRSGGAGGNHQVVITFAGPATVGGLSITSSDGLATATASLNGAVLTLTLSAVANAQTLGITLTGVSVGSTYGNVFLSMGVLLGDTTGDGAVNSGDIAQTKSRSGQIVDFTNFRSDVTVDGALNSGDIALVKSTSGTALPP